MVSFLRLYCRYGTITRFVVTTRGLYQQPCRTG